MKIFYSSKYVIKIEYEVFCPTSRKIEILYIFNRNSSYLKGVFAKNEIMDDTFFGMSRF